MKMDSKQTCWRSTESELSYTCLGKGRASVNERGRRSRRGTDPIKRSASMRSIQRKRNCIPIDGWYSLIEERMQLTVPKIVRWRSQSDTCCSCKSLRERCQDLVWYQISYMTLCKRLNTYFWQISSTRHLVKDDFHEDGRRLDMRPKPRQANNTTVLLSAAKYTRNCWKYSRSKWLSIGWKTTLGKEYSSKQSVLFSNLVLYCLFRI